MYPDAAPRCRKAGGTVGALRSYGLLLIRRRLLGDSELSSSSIIKSPSVSSCDVVAGTVPAAELAGVGMVFVVVVIGGCRELLENDDEFNEEVCGGETPVATDEWNFAVVVVLEAAWLSDM